MTRLLTARAVAELLGVCPETVLRWIRDGDLPAIRLSRGAIRIDESELEGWLMERATPARGVRARPAARATSPATLLATRQDTR
jgi:excisionase family DNA binding protein